MKKNLSFLSCDGKTDIHTVIWEPDVAPVGVLQIIHGMVEYIERYDEFARYINSKGFLVVGHDHLGHGQSVRSIEDWGYISDMAQARSLVRDIHTLRKMTQKMYPKLPYFILGHSMGSYLLRRYICSKAEGLSGVIIVGTGQESETKTKAGLMLVRMTAEAKGWRYRSRKITEMTFSGPYKEYDLSGKDLSRCWLTDDREIAKKYYEDDRCQFIFTLSGYEALISTVLYCSKKANIDRIPKDLPMLITSGDKDPVGNMGKSVKKVYQTYVKEGLWNTECKLYPGMHHEILNEVGRDEVYADIYSWIDKRMTQ